MKIKYKFMQWKYNFKHWLFQWNKDKENDLVFSVAGVLHFIKYKEHTIVKVGKNYQPE